MKKINILLFLCCIMFSLSGCDTSEAEMVDNSYVKFGIELVFQAETTDTYKFTLDGDTIKTLQTYYYPSKKTTATLRAYKNNESTPVLEENISIERPEKVVELVQMPGTDISILSGKGEENNPSSENKVRVRLFYNNIEEFEKSIKVDVWVKAGPRGTPVFTNVSFELEEGKLSDYKELDLNYLFPEQTRSPIFITDIWNSKTGELLVDHSSSPTAGRINLGYSYDGNYDISKGFKNDFKLVTGQLNKTDDFAFFEPLYGLCTLW